MHICSHLHLVCIYLTLSEVQNHTIIKDDDSCFQTHVNDGEHGTKYIINMILEHQWQDNRWGVTKHTIIKKIETPFKHMQLNLVNSKYLSTL